MSPILSLILALVITLTIEVSLGTLLLRRKDSIIPLILINVLTNPALNAVLIILFSLTRSYTVYWVALVIGEIAVFACEGFLIRSLCGIRLKHSLLFSTIINSVSLFLGSAIMALI